jgi:hypothetical protein
MKKSIKQILRKLFWGFYRHLLSDKWYAKIRYWLELDEWPDLDNPQKFTEKIQWIKLNEQTQLRQQAANRLAVRNFVDRKIGKSHLVPLIDSFETLTQPIWESLPQQFVLKANHGCGMLSIIYDKEEEHFKTIHQKTEKWKQTNYYRFGREWAYKGLPRKILAEKLLLTQNGSIPKDYKFFCFHGKVKLIQVDYDRFGDQKRNLFNPNFELIEGKLLYPPYGQPVQRPQNLDEAITIAEALATDFSFIRVDLYLMKDHIYFGELTNYPGNGFVPFQPEKLEYKVGTWLDLNRELT